MKLSWHEKGKTDLDFITEDDELDKNEHTFSIRTKSLHNSGLWVCSVKNVCFNKIISTNFNLSLLSQLTSSINPAVNIFKFHRIL